MSASEKSGSKEPNAGEVLSAAGVEASQERLFRAVADYTYDWESWHAPDGRLIWVNPAVERITGYSVAQCLAMPNYPLPLIAREDQENISRLLDSARNRTSGESEDFRTQSPDGRLRWVSLVWQPMLDGAGTYLGFRTSVRDITERRSLREQVRLHVEHLEQLVQERTEKLRQLELQQRQMEKLVALGQLAAGIAHEINNPLAGIRNAFELIKSSISPGQEHFELIGLIDKEIERISGITHQMYQLYKRAPQKPGEFDMIQSLSEVVFMLKNTAEKHQIQLEFRALQRPLRVLLVEGEVKQVLYNLIRNAIQASSPKTAVSIRVKHRAQEVVVDVEDRGSGIRDDIMPRIFDPFFSTKHGESQAGMGLGLSVSRSIIEAMGGRIEVASRVGQGSRFSAFFPLRVDAQQGA